jgi:hypothetical protein
MVCPVNHNQPERPAEEDCEAPSHPDEVPDILELLRSPDPEVRRTAARLLEVSSLGALNAAETWRTANRDR